MSRIADRTFLKEEKVVLKRAINTIVVFAQKDTGILQDDIARLLGFSLSHLKRLKSANSQTNLTQRNISQICRIGFTDTSLLEIGEKNHLTDKDKENIRVFFSSSQPFLSDSPVSHQRLEQYCKSSMLEELDSFGYRKLLDIGCYKNSIVFWSILERDLIRFSVTLAIKYARIIFSNKNTKNLIQNNVFTYGGEGFSMNVSSPDDNALCFSIKKENPTKNNEKCISNQYMLNESAKYRVFFIDAQNVPSSCYVAIEEILNVIVDRVYCFLDYLCLEYDFGQPLDIINKLYALCRASIPVNQPFWLYLIHEDGAVYLFDGLSKKNALQNISNLGQVKKMSRSDCLVRMMCQQSSSKDVVDANIVIPSNKSTQYHSLNQASKISMISYPQHLMMGEGLMTIRPLVGTEAGCIYDNDVSWLTVVYAENNNSGNILANHFDKLRHKLLSILLSNQNLISMHMKSDNGRMYYK
jgi:hypothetical protein